MPEKYPCEVRLKAHVGYGVRLDESVEGIITEISIKGEGIGYKIEWWHNGALNFCWVEEYRFEVSRQSVGPATPARGDWIV